MNTKYIPHPIDTSEVVVPFDLEKAIEQLARNVHETWAQGRIEEGWTYGPKRNDVLKQHPSLVEYDELSEEEKEYDRVTAIGTIKLVLKLGWKIEKS